MNDPNLADWMDGQLCRVWDSLIDGPGSAEGEVFTNVDRAIDGQVASMANPPTDTYVEDAVWKKPDSM